MSLKRLLFLISHQRSGRVMKVNSTFTRVLLFAALFIAIGFGQYRANTLPFFLSDYPTYEINGRPHFDSTSESLVLNRIDFESLDLEYPSTFQLWRVSGDQRNFGDASSPDWVAPNYALLTNSDYLLNGAPYVSQVALQSLLWAKLSAALGLENGSYAALRHIHIFFISLIFTDILMWVRWKFGPSQAAWSAIAICTSTGVAVFASSLYWSIALFFLPMWMATLYARFSSVPFPYFIGALFAAFFVKFSSGYEFISTVVILATLPALADFSRIGAQRCIIQCATIFLTALTAFAASLTLYHNLFLWEFEMSGLEHIFSRSSSWAGLDAGGTSLKFWTGQAARTLIMSAVSIDRFGVPIAVLLAAYLFLAFRFWRNIPINERLFMFGALVATASWYVLQPGHILFHPRYSPLIMFPILLSFSTCLLPRAFSKW